MSDIVKRPIYLVVWRDAFNDKGDWEEIDLEDIDGMEQVLVHSVGYLGRENKHYIELLSSVDTDNDNVANPMTIPKGCIVSKTRLNPGKPVR